MSSELKSETSRINGAKSHGPKTPEGKETSSRNSFKHGFTASNTYILECESAEEYKLFLAEHIAIHQPVTAPEKELVDQMAIARWRIRRFVKQKPSSSIAKLSATAAKSKKNSPRPTATFTSPWQSVLSPMSLAACR